jgi:hypothetical protein
MEVYKVVLVFTLIKIEKINNLSHRRITDKKIDFQFSIVSICYWENLSFDF